MQKGLKTVFIIIKTNLKIMLITLPIAILFLVIGILLVISNSLELVGSFNSIGRFSNQIIAGAAVITLFLMFISNERARKVFVGQNMPQIDVTPTKVIQGATHVATLFSVANYSGFTAYNICIDMKYGGNFWIGEWVKADRETNRKPSSSPVILRKPYDLGLAFSLGELRPGRYYEFPEEGVSGQLGFSGSLILEEEVCSEGEGGFPISIRVRWNSKKGHTFEKSSEYKLICTKVKNGRAFTMIPSTDKI